MFGDNVIVNRAEVVATLLQTLSSIKSICFCHLIPVGLDLRNELDWISIECSSFLKFFKTGLTSKSSWQIKTAGVKESQDLELFQAYRGRLLQWV
jgi:hypothetical protein